MAEYQEKAEKAAIARDFESGASADSADVHVDAYEKAKQHAGDD